MTTKATLVSSSGGFATWCCPTCQNLHRLPVDEELTLWPCQGSDECTAVVCSRCQGPMAEDDDNKCRECGNRACPQHLHDGVCDICIAGAADGPVCPYCGETGGEPVYIEGRSPSRWYNGEDGDPGEEGGEYCTLCDPRKPRPDEDYGLIPEAPALLGWTEEELQ